MLKRKKHIFAVKLISLSLSGLKTVQHKYQISWVISIVMLVSNKLVATKKRTFTITAMTAGFLWLWENGFYQGQACWLLQTVQHHGKFQRCSDNSPVGQLDIWTNWRLRQLDRSDKSKDCLYSNLFLHDSTIQQLSPPCWAVKSGAINSSTRWATSN